VKFPGRSLAILALALSGHAATFGVYSGASYQTVVAPNSWAVAFGSQMAFTTVTATLSSAGQWPTTLANTSVQVDGQPAELYYVSPTQINFLVPDVTDFGSVSVVITTAAGATLTSTLNLQNTAAGVFTSNSSGSGPGAILNGVTNAGPPFLVVTPQNGGSDLRTRLAVYCTGLRYAGNPSQNASMTNVAANVTALGMDTAGNQYNFAVEYAGGSDPAFPGLDQVNIVLPAQLDGAGVVSLTITAEANTSNTVTFQVNSLPASEIALAGLTLSASEVPGGTSVTGTVSLNGLARTGGFPVSLRTSDLTVMAPAIVTIPQGQVSATFTISTPTVGSVQTSTITAEADTVSFTASLQIDPSNLPQLDLFTVTPASLQGGASFTGAVGLSAPAPAGGAKVQLASNDTVAAPPASVTVQPGATTANVTIPTTAVTAVHNVNLTATLGSATITQAVTVVPPIQLSLNPTSVTGGTAVAATVTLGTVAPTTGANITVTANASGIVSVPAIVSIPAGMTAATFTISTNTVTAVYTVTITVSDGPVGSATANLTVNPQTAGQLESLTVSPTQVNGGGSATGTVTLSGPAPFNGVIVALKSSNSLVAPVPFSVTVPQGSTTATFTIMTSTVASAQTITITATAGSISETATLTVE
jgi:uncharacterized protein (TIGR03437 family)